MSAKDPVPFKVLLVEDNDGFRRSVANLLLSRFPSMVVDEAANSTDALEKAKRLLTPANFHGHQFTGAERAGDHKENQSAST